MPERHSRSGFYEFKPQNTYTRAYYGKLVKDYGFVSLMRVLRRRYPDWILESDLPVRFSGKELGNSHVIRAFNTNTFEEKKFEAVYDIYSGTWRFYDMEGRRIDLDRFL